LVSILIGLVSAKGKAVLLGPHGVGIAVLLQSLLGLPVLIASLGIGTGLVRTIAAATAEGRGSEAAALRRAAWLLRAILGSTTVLVLFLFREPITRLILGDARYSFPFAIVLLGVVFAFAADIQTSLLNAYHRVAALAKVGIVSPAIATVLSLAIIWVWRLQGIAPALAVTSVVGFLVCGYFLWKEGPRNQVAPTSKQVWSAATSLMAFGGPYTASLLVGSGVQLVLPIIVLHTLGTSSVAFYMASVAIAGTYMGFLLAAMGQDYYPRVSAARHRPSELVRLVNEQMRLILILVAPMILALLAVAPYLIPIVYTRAFGPAVTVLEWQLAGDMLKFMSWTMSIVVLARCSSLMFFVVELMGGSVYLFSSWSGMHLYGLAGLGASWVVLYAVYFAIVWFVVRREIPFVWTIENKWMMAAAVVAVLIAKLASVPGVEPLRLGVTSCCAVGAALMSFHILRQELGIDWFRRARSLLTKNGGAAPTEHKDIA
jgi:PST family polysaccharide transporter